MKIALYCDKNRRKQPGIVNEKTGKIIPLGSMGYEYNDMNDLIARASKETIRAMADAADGREDGTALGEVKLLAPIEYPQQDIICLGVNYAKHAEEAARYKKEAFDLKAQYPVYFSKRVNRAVGTGEEIPNYKGLVSNLDYEVELAVIIGKEAKNVKKGESRDYIFGYTILNDVSARELQIRHKQWYFGKSLDGFTPMGPWIVTEDEIAWPPRLDIQCYVNGELRQSDNTGNLCFDIDDVICELSRGMTLRPGTIISMGTPEGVGMGFDPPRFLKAHDEVLCVIENIGELKNRVAD